MIWYKSGGGEILWWHGSAENAPLWRPVLRERGAAGASGLKCTEILPQNSRRKKWLAPVGLNAREFQVHTANNS